MIWKILSLLDQVDKKKLYLLVLLSLLSTFIEMGGLSMIFIILSYVLENKYIIDFSLPYLKIFSFISKDNYLFFITLFLFVIYTFKIIFFIFFYYFQNKFIFLLRNKISVKLLNKYLKKKYSFFVQNNSAVLLRNIDKEVSQMTDQTILSFITLLVEFLILIGVATILITINLKIFFSTMTIFFIIVLVYYLLVKNYILKLGKNRQRLTFHYLKSLNQIFKGIKTIKINKKEPFFEKIFQSVSLKLQKVNVIAVTFSQIPRLTIEFCLILIITIYLMKLYFFNQSLNSDSNELSVIGLFFVASIRIIPSITKIISSFQKLKYSSSSVDLVHQEIEQSKNSEDEILNIENNSLDFNHNITLKNIYFSYHNNDNYNLKNINLEIKKNQILGIVGKSGAGKSTLVDLIAGLIPPQKGQIFIDGKNITAKYHLIKDRISYVSQKGFLLDDTIENNILFGSKKNDVAKLNKLLNDLQIQNFNENSKFKLDSIIGEDGVQISGGQAQRICLARCFYQDRDIMILDEATSSLDIETEDKILDLIKNMKKNKTIILISHKPNIKKICDQIISITDGQI